MKQSVTRRAVERLLTVAVAHLTAVSLRRSLPESDTSSSACGLDASRESSLTARRRFLRRNNRLCSNSEHKLNTSNMELTTSPSRNVNPFSDNFQTSPKDLLLCTPRALDMLNTVTNTIHCLTDFPLRKKICQHMQANRIIFFLFNHFFQYFNYCQ